MPKTLDQKKQIVNALTEGLKSAKLIVLSEIKGLNMKDTTELRSGLRKEQVGHQVVKVSLLKLALSRLGIKTGEMELKTQVAVSYGSDETAPARLLKEFSKKNDKLKLLGGFLEQKYLNVTQVSQLATIPARPVLLGQLVGVLAGPARGLVTVLSGSHRGLVTVLSKINK